VGQHEIHTCQSLQKRDFLFEEEVSTLALEKFVRLFLDLNDNITRLNPRDLISFSMENVALSVWRTLINLNVNDFPFLGCLFTVASFASVFLINYFALSTAVIARSSSLRIHAWADHLHCGLDARPAASSTTLNSAFFTSLAVTLIADAFSVDGNFLGFALIEFFKGALDGVHH
jgi:hypothetical protein